MSAGNINFRNWDGPTYRAGRDVPCQACDATGVCEDGEQIDVDDFRDCLCDHCDGSGVEPWRPAGDRDTSAPRFDVLGNGQLRGWRARLARDKRDSRIQDFQLAWVRKAHREAVARFIGKQVQGWRNYVLAEIEVEVEASIPSITRETADFMNALSRDGYRSEVANDIAATFLGRAA